MSYLPLPSLYSVLSSCRSLNAFADHEYTWAVLCSRSRVSMKDGSWRLGLEAHLRARQSELTARLARSLRKRAAGVEYNVLVNGRQWKLLQSTTKPRSRSSGRGGSSSAVRGGTSPIASGRDFATTSCLKIAVPPGTLLRELRTVQVVVRSASLHKHRTVLYLQLQRPDLPKRPTYAGTRPRGKAAMAGGAQSAAAEAVAANAATGLWWSHRATSSRGLPPRPQGEQTVPLSQWEVASACPRSGLVLAQACGLVPVSDPCSARAPTPTATAGVHTSGPWHPTGSAVFVGLFPTAGSGGGSAAARPALDSCEVAFAYVSLAHAEVAAVLLRDELVPPPPRLDDVDPCIGLHDLRVVMSLRTFGQDLWTAVVSGVDAVEHSRAFARGRGSCRSRQAAEAAEFRVVDDPGTGHAALLCPTFPGLAWRSPTFAGVVPSTVVVDCVVYDEFEMMLWSCSRIARCEEPSTSAGGAVSLSFDAPSRQSREVQVHSAVASITLQLVATGEAEGGGGVAVVGATLMIPWTTLDSRYSTEYGIRAQRTGGRTGK